MIKILNLHKGYRLNVPLVKKIILRVLKLRRKHEGLELGLVFLDDKAIKNLNKIYKSRSRPTDVLSFDFGDAAEVFISLDRALDNSRTFGTKFENEVVLYIIHGILHLSGYDDETMKGKMRMSAKEKKILESLCREEHLSKVLTRL